MDQKLKQRLTGAIVLVALAVIFVPIILEGPDNEWTPRSHSIPEQPQMDYRASMELELPEPLSSKAEPSESVITEALSLQEETAPAHEPPAAEEKTAPVAQKPVEPVVTAPPPPKAAPAAPPPAKTEKPAEPALQGWFVQVGSFGQELNATGLRERLKSAGYDTRLQKVAIGKGYAYRVLVGPSTSRAAAEKLAASLKAGQQLSGMVIQYP
ncbi:MAG: SPOR domain-containing protein [Gammaproteobacteria bacterium]|jgi:DedD protein|nr:SPOR domain-containing protein [Gammaproteobacteria bacterium]